MFQHPGLDAGAGVFDLDLHELARGAGADYNSSPPLDGLPRVQYQIHQHLFDLGRIGPYRQRGLAKIIYQRNVPFHELIQGPAHGVDQRVQLKGDGAERLPSPERAQTVRDGRGTPRGGQDLADALPKPLIQAVLERQ